MAKSACDDIRRHSARNIREFRSRLDRLCNAFSVIREVVENRRTFILRRPDTSMGVVVQANRRRSVKSQRHEELVVSLDDGIERQFSGVIREAVETWQALLNA